MIEAYLERSLAENVACATVAAAAAATAAHAGANLLKPKGTDYAELPVWAVLTVAAVAYATSWATELGVRKMFKKHSR